MTWLEALGRLKSIIRVEIRWRLKREPSDLEQEIDALQTMQLMWLKLAMGGCQREFQGWPDLIWAKMRHHDRAALLETILAKGLIIRTIKRRRWSWINSSDQPHFGGMSRKLFAPFLKTNLWDSQSRFSIFSTEKFNRVQIRENSSIVTTLIHYASRTTFSTRQNLPSISSWTNLSWLTSKF